MAVTVVNWILMTAGFIIMGLSGLKFWGKIQDKRLDKKFPEKKENHD